LKLNFGGYNYLHICKVRINRVIQYENCRTAGQ